ncbi:DNA polymerase III subunit delta [bacterium]|nr:DNA polymerase III subunit delta [candidate division CSSED10-310 bacterium]
MRDTVEQMKRIVKKLEEGARPPVVLVTGEDEYLIRRIANRALTGLAGDGGSLGITVFDAVELDPSELRVSLGSLSLFVASVTIDLRGLVPSARGGGALVETIVQWLAESAGSRGKRSPCLVVECHKLLPEKNKLLVACRDAGEVVTIAGMDTYHPGDPDRDPSFPWVTQIAGELGVRLDLQAFQLLRQRVDGDMWSLKTELDKLAAYVGGKGRISTEDVAAVVPQSRTEVIFELVDALVAMEREKTLELLNRILDSGTHILQVVRMLHRQIRFMLQAHGVLKQEFMREWQPRMRYNEFTRGCLPALKAWSETNHVDRKAWFVSLHPFLIQRLFEQVSQFRLKYMIRFLIDLAEIDLAAKSGGSDPVMYLERVLLGLMEPDRNMVRHGV